MKVWMTWTALALLGATAYACGDDDAATSGPTSSTGATTSSSSAATGQGGATATSTGQGGATSSSTGMGGQGVGGQGVGGGGICAPDPGGDPCQECVKMDCCTQLTACVADTDCQTCLACLQTAPDPMTCVGGDCQFTNMASSDLLQCIIGNCLGDQMTPGPCAQ